MKSWRLCGFWVCSGNTKLVAVWQSSMILYVNFIASTLTLQIRRSFPEIASYRCKGSRKTCEYMRTKKHELHRQMQHSAIAIRCELNIMSIDMFWEHVLRDLDFVRDLHRFPTNLDLPTRPAAITLKLHLPHNTTSANQTARFHVSVSAGAQPA